MQIVVDVDTGGISSRSFTELKQIAFQRLFQGPIEVYFSRQSRVIGELPGGTPGSCVIVSSLGGPLLASATEWTQIGSGASAFYAFHFDLNSVPLEGDEEVTGLFEANPASVAGLFQLAWEPPGQALKSATIKTTILNGAIIGPVTAPQPAAPIYPPANDLIRKSLANAIGGVPLLVSVGGQPKIPAQFLPELGGNLIGGTFGD